MKRVFQHGLLLTVLTLGLFFKLSAQSIQMTIYMNDGTEQMYYMSESDRVFFEDNKWLVVEIAPTAKSDRYLLSEIRKVVCSETEGMIEEGDVSVFLSPNPVHDAFMIHNLGDRQTVSIYALDGRLLKTLEASSDQSIDISDLTIGLYLVKIHSRTLKIIKL